MKIKKILVSQPKPSSEKSPYYDLEKKYGFVCDFHPFIKVEGLNVRDFLAQRIDVLSHTAVIFTARTAIDHFFRLAEELRITIPEDMKYFCSSESIALYLQKYIQYRKRKVFFSPTGKADGLLPSIKKHNTENYLLAVSDVNKGDFTKLLDAENIQYEKAAFYKTVSNDFGPDEPLDHDMLIFFSPEGINSLKKNFPNFEQGDILIAAFGASTAKAVTDAGLRLDVSAPTPEAPSMTGALDQFCQQHKVNKK
ncbi:MAG: uroporphyrinogen-III synthase [Paludibacteraceae bacterium]|nr:uroporphyrinogen-III synthase [Paludibacteraceae bacterium]